MQQITQAHKSQTLSRATPPKATPDPRWSALRLVQAAMEPLALKDRDVAVLRGLLSFIPADRWDGPLVVFASNAALQARCDGIDERTLRRRLARLAELGLIRRNQSPNRKRYVVRDHKGAALLTYGFDLAPLRESLARLQTLGETHEIALKQIDALKSVLRDHLYRFTQQGFQPETDAALIAEYYRLLRRKASTAELSEAIRIIAASLKDELDTETPNVSKEVTDGDGQIDRHIQSSDKEYLERKNAPEPKTQDHATDGSLSVSLCLEAASSCAEFAQQRPRNWPELVALARQLAPAIGVEPQQMLRATHLLGERGVSLAILGLVEAYPRIREPKRYLNTLLNRATTVGLNMERMFRSLTGWARFPAGNHAQPAV